MIDTHAHLQFKVFKNNVDEVINRAFEAGIKKIVVVGTNLETSKNAIKLAEKYAGLYASIGIHPHHVFPYRHPAPDAGSREHMKEALLSLEELIDHPKLIAIGETGLDKHIYLDTKYKNYQITEEFINLQKIFFKEQIKLAIKHKKALIIHNREAVEELLQILEENWNPALEGRSVFHCCEPDHRLLRFASAHNVFIGIDGDITYNRQKQEFMKQIPIKLLVLETDSPYFLPKPQHYSYSNQELINNEPKNIGLIAEFAVKQLNINLEEFQNIVTNNSIKLFDLSGV